MIPKAKSLSSHGRRVVMLSKKLARLFSKSKSLSYEKYLYSQKKIPSLQEQ